MNKVDAMTAHILSRIHVALLTTLVMGWLTMPYTAFGQAFGVELNNTMMPASGGMGGTSIAQPQDLLSAINGNPATMTQFRGTQFTFSGGWAEANYDLAHTGNGDLPGIGPFESASGTPGTSLGNIGVTQDMTVLGLPVTAGVALVTTAGLGVDFAAEPNSNNSALTLQILKFMPGVGVKLTDRLSAGANFAVETSTFDGLFVGSSKATPAFAARGSLGLNYRVNCRTRIGAYYQTEARFIHEDAIVLQPFAGLPGRPVDVIAELPHNIGFGFANDSLANGRLLIAGDVLFKFWQSASLFDAIWKDQLVVQLGAQYSLPRVKLRAGYVWADERMVDVPGNVISGITPPGAANAIQYIQGLASNINQHRLSGGIGIPNVLPGVDMDFFGGTMFEATENYGLTSARVSSYYLGGGFTWRFNRGSGCHLTANDWCGVAGNNSYQNRCGQSGCQGQCDCAGGCQSCDQPATQSIDSPAAQQNTASGYYDTE